MIRICRAEDGQLFQVNASLRDIERSGSLEIFLQQEIGIEAGAVLAYLTDGRRLTNTNLREFAGSQDQSIFVFNKYYLDYDVEKVIRDLTIGPSLQPPIEESISGTPPFRPTQLAASYLRVAHTHLDYIKDTALSLQCQHEAIRIASSGLDIHVLSVVDAFESLGSGLRKELQKQASLLAGVEADLNLITKVRVHTDFVSANARKAIEAGEKPRTLGDYVSNAKMKQVAETCAKTHNDLQARFDATEQKIAQVREGCDSVRATVSSTKTLEDTEACLRRSHEIFDSIASSAGGLEYPKTESEPILQDLKQLDSNLRSQVQLITDLKNTNTRQCIATLRHISVINNDLVHIPPELTALQASFRGKNSFLHLQRLHNMLYAYGATVIEIVRRKEFAQFFYHRAQSILEVMAKLSSSERKRRQVYRSEIHGQLPFETKGLDDAVPTIDFSPSAVPDPVYSLEREDIDGLFRLLDDLEEVSRSHNEPAALSAVRECKVGLERLVAKMDGLEAGFDKIAERSLLSSSRISHSRRRSLEVEEQMYNGLVEQFRMVQDAKAHQEAMFQEERLALKGEIHRLQSDMQNLDSDAATERERADRLERELHQVRAQLESENTARRIKEERNMELLCDLGHQREELARALKDVTEQTRVSEALRQELAQIKSEFDDVKALEARNSEKVTNLLVDQAKNLKNLEEARSRGEDLEEQIRAARAECEGVNFTLKQASEEKDRLLRVQASEHDRVLRDHIAEADGDRAVLERQFFECKAAQEHAERQLKELRSELEVERADAVGLREELQRVEHELREARHVERLLRDDLKTGRASQSEFEQQLENGNRLIAQILDVALAFRVSHLKALHTAQSITSHPTSTSRQSATLADSVYSPDTRHSIITQPEEPPPIDPSDPANALEALRAFDHDYFQEAVSKTGSTVRKWQKQCKEYRERAKGKISFRNFAKGDLALFLPTRNSVSKPWAAFNVSFPHYFLQATGHLAEQLKTREWIVARITSITERVVDRDDPSSNPYGLGDGVKYYMLEVEDWTKPSHNKRRLSSRKETPEVEEPKPPSSMAASTSALPPGPPEADVDSNFEVTHPPNSQLFPTRSRSNSSPTARPSSLSRLLAQASPEPPEPVAELLSETPSTIRPRPLPTPFQAAASPPLPSSLSQNIDSSPSQHTGSVPSVPQNPAQPSPLRPGSRASRLSTTSRFSVGRIPLGSVPSGSPVKAAPTIALTDRLVSSPSSIEGAFGNTATPSPEGSMSDGITNLLKDSSRRRTSSYHAPRKSLLAPAESTATTAASSPSSTTVTPFVTPGRPGMLASLASSWGVSLGRKKKVEVAGNVSETAGMSPSEDHGVVESPSAKQLLKKF
ncbi:autophagy-related protein 11 [Moniliophthora roreri MCA 2997]|uniref:Autophagy-related protein 11 n=1 Tax=Moniliophthora roreri (strain MCA 2997) TaxID=1381753 RepID=V2XE34_MONRO|nr:autophagy-related protein 11 [Moniliophthora roreri MCA 2997]